MQEFERDEKNNLYKLWNRMSSGSYMPTAVRRVEIPKADGGTRPLGIPTVTDRIAQMVVAQRLQPKLEKLFHNNSYGYRPGKSAYDAVGMARLRCWERDWVLEVDIKGFFDAIDHALLLRALDRHVTCRWERTYIERWLKVGVQMPDGSVQVRERGTPQGGVISPLLANVFLHYAFDSWMVRQWRNTRFERYADDIVCHCQTRAQAQTLLKQLAERMNGCGLQLHPLKTRVVYCGKNRDIQRKEAGSFDFLGFTFKQRKVQRQGRYVSGFNPAISTKAAQAIRQTINEWDFRRNAPLPLERLREYWNSRLQGWINYYGAPGRYGSQLDRVLRHFDFRLARWYALKTWGLCSGSHLLAGKARVGRLRRSYPYLFAHWRWVSNKTSEHGHAWRRAV